MVEKFMLAIIRGYQRFVSPLLPARCRYYPTCSQYTIDAICTHGSVKGLMMGIARIMRCHPFVKGGIDYVPLKFSLRRNKDLEYHGPYTYRYFHSNKSNKSLKK